ncbi:Imm65 family immunity protein, partial [Bacteroides thetaiotaomicron]
MMVAKFLILVKMLPNYYRLFEYPELWSYFSGD